MREADDGNDHLHGMVRRALSAGLSFRMRLQEDDGQPTLYLRLLDSAGETSWAAPLPPGGDIEEALLDLFDACAQKVVEIGEREAGDELPAGRPLPMGTRFL